MSVADSRMFWSEPFFICDYGLRLTRRFANPRVYRKTSLAPNLFHMGHAFFDVLNGQRGAELEYLDVLGFDKRFERGEVHATRTRRAMVARRRLHVMDMKPAEPIAERF